MKPEQPGSAVPNTPEEASAWLTKGLRTQLACYESVLALAQEQKALIVSGQAEGLMELLARKQRMIAEIERLQNAIRPCKERWDAEGDAWPPALRAPVESVVQALRHILGEIVALEDAGREELGDSSQKAGQKITQMQKGKAMHRAYGNTAKPPASPPHFKDRNA